MKHFSKKSPLEEPLINLTPLIDVVFVVLIMFIVVAPLLNTDTVELAEANHENTSKTESPKASLITIRVTKENQIFLNNQKVDPQILKQKLAELKKTNPKERLQLFHDKEASFGTYQKIKNMSEEVGFEEMDVILK